jgi:hypothetical protein
MFIRPALVVVAFLATFTALAQTPSYVFYRTEAPIDRADLKQIIGQVTDVDPMAEVFHSDDYTVIQVKLGSVSEPMIRAAITQAGVALRPGTVDAATLQPAPQDGPPVFLVTDDPAADRARYQAAMEAWNAAHPEAPVTAPIHLNER